MMKRNHNQFGFTLAELLVAIALIITSATVVATIITAGFRGASKTNINEELRQSGTSALNQLGKMIQFADSFEGAVPGESTDGVPDSVCVSAEDAAETNATYSSISIKVDDEVKSISCDDEGLFLDDQPLFDESKVTVRNCQLKCIQDTSSDAPLIGISFDLIQGTSDLPEQETTINSFSKQVKMRNYNQ